MSFSSWLDDDRDIVDTLSYKTGEGLLNKDVCKDQLPENVKENTVNNYLQTSSDKEHQDSTVDTNCDSRSHASSLEARRDKIETKINKVDESKVKINENLMKERKRNEKENSKLLKTSTFCNGQQGGTTSHVDNYDAVSLSSWLDGHHDKIQIKADNEKKRKENEKENSKVIKPSNFYNGQNVRMPRTVKVDIRDIRKKRLREIALKPADETKSKTNGVKVSAAKKVKVSESRGNFLIKNQEPVPSTSKKDMPEPSTEKSKIIIPITVKRKVPIIEPHTEKNRLKRQCSNNHEQTQSSSTKSDSLKHLNSHYIAVTHKNEDVEEIIKEMLLWNPYWLVECKQMKTVPPKIHQGQLQRMPKRFSSYEEYYNIVTPPMMIELWSFLAKEYEQQKNKVLAEIIEVKVDPKQTTLHYFTYIDKKQTNTNSHVKENDIMIVNYEREVKNKKKKFETKFALGFVTKITKTFLQPNDYINKNFVDSLELIPYVRLNFNVLITSYEGTIVKGVNTLRVIASIISPLRMFKSVKGLRKSKLLSHVLHPTTDIYKIELPVEYQQLYCKATLNTSQKKAVLEASYMCQRNAPGIYLIQGPPGTGKTTVILNILRQILYNPNCSNRKCILILAPSNAAVDELVFRIAGLKKTMKDEGRELKLIRYGPKNMIHAKALKYSLSEIAKTNVQNDLFPSLPQSSQQVLKSKKQLISDLRTSVSSPDCNGKDKLAIAIQDYDKMCQKLMGTRYYSCLQRCEEKLLIGAEVICTTLSSCIRFQMEDIFRRNPGRISCCIVDEATQSNEQETLTPLKLGVSKLVLVGDPKQLPGVTQAKEVKNSGYGESLLTRIMSNFPNDKTSPVQLLNVQYRMHPQISQFPNKVFYSGLLKDSEHLKTRPSIFKNLRPYLVFNFDMESIVNSQEYVNKPETFCVIKLLNIITKHYTNTYTVGIVTPYNNQKTQIANHLKVINYRPSITVNTVDSFQGQEKDIIIMSCVRENTNNFLSDAQRLNVAMTRARHALYIIGSANLFMTSNIFGIIRSDAQRRNLLIDVFPHTSEEQLLKHLLNTSGT